MFAFIGGIAGWIILKDTRFNSAPGWVLITFGFITLEASWLTTIAYGLRADEKWDAQFNPGLDPSRATRSRWPVVLTVIFSLIFGAAVMMTFLAIAFEQFFISQLLEAKKLSQ